VLRLQLNQCEFPEQEYSVADTFMTTVKSELIKSDIISYLAKRWKKENEIDDIRKHFSVKIENKESKLKLSSHSMSPSIIPSIFSSPFP
jgi:hypothetical protein